MSATTAVANAEAAVLEAARAYVAASVRLTEIIEQYRVLGPGAVHRRAREEARGAVIGAQSRLLCASENLVAAEDCALDAGVL